MARHLHTARSLFTRILSAGAEGILNIHLRDIGIRRTAIAFIICGMAAGTAFGARPHTANRVAESDVEVTGTQAFQLSPGAGTYSTWLIPAENAEPVSSTAGHAEGVVAGDGCTGTLVGSHTDANFDGGSFILQLGFAEDEIFAAEYSVPPGYFPITIRQINFILAQNSDVETTTHYTVFIWDGVPGGGANSIEIAQFNSMEDLAPVVMPGGAPAGTNVQIQVDPNDPEQIVIDNVSGTNSFSIGVRIDQHNMPPLDPCFPIDNLERNAYPAVDFSGLQSTTGNWIFALDCLGGCPSGWNRFSQLGICTPSGDWVMKATYECSVAVEFGACCSPDGECIDNVANLVCAQFGEGSEFFSGEFCADVTCAQPTGACCAFDTCLIDQTVAECDGFGGQYLGDGTDCAGSPCTPGACCMGDGTCTIMVGAECESAGGSFEGPGTACSPNPCPQPTGACCFGEVCVNGQLQENCEVTGVWVGPFTTCDSNPCVAGCPGGTILSSTPISGTVDARQPFAPSATAPRMGIGSADEPITIEIGESGAEDCFELCETGADAELGINGIASVTDTGGGVYEIVLDHPIAPGEATTVRYLGDDSFVVFVSHPANVNADSVAAPSDILAIIDALNGISSAPYGLYSTDADHSGEAGPSDIIRVIDLLNGAGVLDAWVNTDRPTTDGCP